MRLKIVSNGTGPSTSIVNAETGEEVAGVTAITWTVRADGLATAQLEIIAVQAEVEAELTTEVGA